MDTITHRRILRIALPIVISNATVPLLGAVDTAVVGQMGQAAPIGAVGLGAIVLASVYWIFGFLRMGTSGLVAQAHGAGDAAEVAAGLWRGLMIALVAGAALVALQYPIVAAAFAIAPASAEVEALAQDYISIRVWGAPATIAMYAITGWLIALERTRDVLVLQLAMNGLNVVLDLVFVPVLGMGVQGVALATLIAEASGVVLGLWFCRGALAPIAQAGVRAAAHAVMARGPLRRMLAVNGDIMVRTILLQGAFTSFLFLGAGQGDVALAANQVLMQFLYITAFAMDGFAFAAESLVGQAVGARSARLVRQAALRTSLWGVAGAAMLAAMFALAGPVMIDVLTSAEDVRAAARQYLPWVAATALIGISSWMLDGIFIGATLTREMRNAMLVSVAVYAGAVVVLLPVFGNHGLWAALLVLNAVRGLTMARLYPRAEAAAAPAGVPAIT